MRVAIAPSRAVGRVSAPPSKSMAHRALICGALSEGSRVENLAFSKDIKATIDCLEKLGANVKTEENGVFIGGLDLSKTEEGSVLFCNESGSTLRFILPLCMTAGKRLTLTGSERLFLRPLGIYESIAAQQGILFEKTENSVTVCGRLAAGDYTVSGDVSSQFVSGLLFALPLLEGDSTLTVTEPFESASYVELTRSMLSRFGVDIRREGNVFYIKGGKSPKATEYEVEGDCSNAAFLEAFNLLGGEVEVEGIAADTLQGDRVYKDIFRRLAQGNGEFDLSDCPDLAPICFALAAALNGARFNGTSRLKIKESDRAAAMAQELAKFGVKSEVMENSVTVSCGLNAPNVPLSGHNDHRIVMSMALLCSVTGGIIEGAEAVSKSYPDFFDRIKGLGIEVEENEINNG